MSADESTHERCGFVLEPGDVHEDVAADYETGSDEWYVDSEAVCCWRSVWAGVDADRCIWHAESDAKPVDELVKARTDEPERLYGVYVPAVELGDSIDFEECRLLAAAFVGTDLRGALFAEVDGRYARFPDADLNDAQFPDADLRGAQFPDADLRDAQFHDANLAGAQFPGAHLRATEFPDADLRGAQFPDADLQHTRFSDANLTGAQFSDANLRGAGFSGAFLWEAVFSDADLTGAEFPNTQLTGAQFFDAGLHAVEFTDAHLTDARFPDADLLNARFSNAVLAGAEFAGANLQGTLFYWANLRQVDFTAANLEDADLTGADLFDADLRKADLYGATMDGVSINRQTKFGSHYVESRPGGLRGGFKHLPAQSRIFGNELRLAISPGRSGTDDEDRLGKAAWSFRKVEQLSKDAGLSKQARSYNVQRKDVERRLYLVENGSRLRWTMALLSSFAMRYGESPWRVVGLSLLAIFAAAGCYIWYGLRLTGGEESMIIGAGTGNAALPILVGKSLYFSTITFTTVGYGDIQPIGWSQTIATVESFLGALLMALLVYVLGRRATW